jgi:hypothetical protein
MQHENQFFRLIVYIYPNVVSDLMFKKLLLNFSNAIIHLGNYLSRVRFFNYKEVCMNKEQFQGQWNQ